MFKKYNIGIMGTGNIAGVMADTVNKMKNVKLYAVASREKVKADVFVLFDMLAFERRKICSFAFRFDEF